MKITKHGKVTIDFSDDHENPNVLIENFNAEGGTESESELAKLVVQKIISELVKDLVKPVMDINPTK